MSPQQAVMDPSQAAIDAAKAPIAAYTKKDWAAVKAALSPDFVYDEVATGRTVKGADQAIALWQGWATALPDSAATFHNAVASGNGVAIELTWRGTHKGPLQGPNGTIQPTGKQIEIRAVQVSELANGKVKSTRHYFDMATLLQQIGVNT